MAKILILAGVIWFAGRWFSLPRAVTGVVIALLFAMVAVLQLTLPDGHALREATGGSLRNWSVPALIAAIIGAYAMILPWLHRRSAANADAGEGSDGAGSEGSRQDTFSTSELERYARHIVLREVGGLGQKKLKSARVLVIGAGGLGSPAMLYLAAAGVGTIGVIDDDVVEATNLQRQIIHTDATIGMPKVFSAEAAIRALNPYVTVRPYHRRLGADIAAELFDDYDLILDGTDNFATRYLVNTHAVKAEKPLISAAMTQWEGQISLYAPATGGPCYQCVFPEPPADGLVPSCAEAGVIAPLPGILGSMMALEAVKHITGAGRTLAGTLLIHDALYGETRRITLQRRDDCPVCGGVNSA